MRQLRPPTRDDGAPRLSPGASFLLDLVRLAAALVVAWGHLTLPAFSTGITNRMEAAGAAVIVFFVLSGFVIRYVSRRALATFTAYTIDPRLQNLFRPATGGHPHRLGSPALRLPPGGRLATGMRPRPSHHAGPSLHQLVVAPAGNAATQWRAVVHLI